VAGELGFEPRLTESESVSRLRGIIGKVFRLAVATLCNDRPEYALRDALAAPIITLRSAITDERRLGALMSETDIYKGWLQGIVSAIAPTTQKPSRSDSPIDQQIAIN
jgi:hypothetical protein